MDDDDDDDIDDDIDDDDIDGDDPQSGVVFIPAVTECHDRANSTMEPDKMGANGSPVGKIPLILLSSSLAALDRRLGE